MISPNEFDQLDAELRDLKKELMPIIRDYVQQVGGPGVCAPTELAANLFAGLPLDAIYVLATMAFKELYNEIFPEELPEL